MKLAPAAAGAVLASTLLALPAAAPAAVAAPSRHNHCNYPPSRTVLTLSVSRSDVISGHRVVLFGALFNHRCTIKDARVQVFGNGHKLVTIQTDNHGGYHVIFHPHRTRTYRAAFAGNRYASHALSNRVKVAVTPATHH